MVAVLPARSAVVLSVVLLGSGTPSPAAADSGWVWPVEGARSVLRPFDPPASRYGPGHRGVDLAAGTGAVRAAGAGRVSYAGLLAGRGVVVVVHGDLRTTYEPVAALVSVGDAVVAGELIGEVAGEHAGCARACLHWGLLRGEDYLDPLSLVRRGPSRLLPVPAPAGFSGSGGGRAGVARAAPRVTLAPAAPPGEPGWSLRSARGQQGVAALLALLLGLALVIRSRPRPPDPHVSALAGRPPSPPLAEEPPGQVAEVVDLSEERTLRRA